MYNNGQNNQGYNNPMDLYSNNSNNINYNENYTGINQNSFEEPREEINAPYLIRKSYMITTIFAIIGFLLSFYVSDKLPFNLSFGISITMLIVSVALPILAFIFSEIKVPLMLVNIVLMLTTYGLTSLFTIGVTADDTSFVLILMCVCVCINGMAWQGIKLLFGKKRVNLALRGLLCFIVTLIISIILSFVFNGIASNLENIEIASFLGFFVSLIYILIVSLQIDKMYKKIDNEDYIALATYKVHMGVLLLIFVIIGFTTGQGGQVNRDFKQIKRAGKLNHKGNKNMFD